MGKNYTVVVSEVNESGDEVTVIELRGPIEVLQRFAPTAVADVLGAPVARDYQASPVTDGELDDARQRLQDRGVLPADTDQPKRRRRTKAEMEAARAKTSGEIRQAEGAEAADRYESESVNTPVASAEALTTSDPVVAELQPAYSPFG